MAIEQPQIRKLTGRPYYKAGEKVRETKLLAIPLKVFESWESDPDFNENMAVYRLGNDGQLGLLVLPANSQALKSPKLMKKLIGDIEENLYELNFTAKIAVDNAATQKSRNPEAEYIAELRLAGKNDEEEIIDNFRITKTELAKIVKARENDPELKKDIEDLRKYLPKKPV